MDSRIFGIETEYGCLIPDSDFPLNSSTKIEAETECRRPGPECTDFPLNSSTKIEAQTECRRPGPECIDFPLNPHRN